MRFLLSVLVLGLTVCADVDAGVKPRLTAQMRGKQVGLVLEKLDVEVNICQPAVETKMTMIFFNPHDAKLVGELEFPIPSGATVTGYALDIDGRMRDGVVIEQDRGRDVFDSNAAKKINHGLIEWAGFEAFNTEVFPIPRKGRRTISVSYVTNTDHGRVRIPLSFGLKMPRFELKVGALTRPEVRTGKSYGLGFSKSDSGFAASMVGKDVDLKEDLTLEFDKAKRSNIVIQRSSDGMNYFAYFCNSLPLNRAPKKPRRIRKVTICWDASHSRRNADHDKEIAFLRALLGKIPGAEIDLAIFRNTLQPKQSYKIRDGQYEKLFKDLGNVVYDGATRIKLPDKIDDPAGRIVLLFSDGECTLGEALPRNYPIPVYAVAAGPVGIAARRLTLMSSGAVLNLRKESITQLVSSLLSPAEQVEANAPINVELVARGPLTPWCKGTWLYGRFKGKEAELDLNYVGNTVKSHVLEAGKAPSGEGLRRLWAHAKRHRIEHIGENRKGELLELGKKHQILTPKTSFIVLENLEQYLDYGIRPPAAEKSLCAAYDKEMAERKGNDPWALGDDDIDGDEEEPEVVAAERKKRLDSVLRQWQEHVQYTKKLRSRGWHGTRIERSLTGYGGNHTLNWINRTQNPDGSWGSGRFRAAHTGLMILSLLAHGETPLSEKYGYVVQRGMRWLSSYARHPISRKIAKEPAGTYAHAMASWAIAESYAMTKIPFLKTPMEDAIDVIVKGQLENGGFNYGYQALTNGKKRSDLSLTAWHANALKSARYAGCENPKLQEATQKIVRFVRSTYLPGKGFSYDGGTTAKHTLTGAATNTLQILGAGDTPEAKAGLELIMEHQAKNLQRVIDHPEEWDKVAGENLYSWYFDTKAMFNSLSRRRDHWKKWRKLIEIALVKHQKKEGYWETNGKHGIGAKTTSGRILASSLCALMLENYYCYLPTYDPKRQGTVDTGDAAVEEEEPIPTESISGGTRRPPAKDVKRKQESALDADYNAYLKQLHNTKEQDRAFFIDQADEMFIKGKADLAVRILSNLAELKTDHLENLCAIAIRLIHYGRPTPAIAINREILRNPDADATDFWRLVRTLIHNGNHEEAMQEIKARFQRNPVIDDVTEVNRIFDSLPKDKRPEFPLPNELRRQETAAMQIRLLWSTDSSLRLKVSSPSPTRKEITADVLAVVNPTLHSWGREFIAYKTKPGTYNVELSTGYPREGRSKLAFAIVEVVQDLGSPNEVRKQYPMRIRLDKKVHDVCKVQVTGN